MCRANLRPYTGAIKIVQALERRVVQLEDPALEDLGRELARDPLLRAPAHLVEPLRLAYRADHRAGERLGIARGHDDASVADDGLYHTNPPPDHGHAGGHR